MASIDQAIGARIRMYRKALGMSQTDLANQIGVRFQQVQKYENGSNRVAASRLWKIADALGVSVVSLFQDVSDAPGENLETTELVDLFRRLRAPERAEALFFLRALAARTNAPPEAATGT